MSSAEKGLRGQVNVFGKAHHGQIRMKKENHNFLLNDFAFND